MKVHFYIQSNSFRNRFRNHTSCLSCRSTETTKKRFRNIYVGLCRRLQPEFIKRAIQERQILCFLIPTYLCHILKAIDHCIVSSEAWNDCRLNRWCGHLIFGYVWGDEERVMSILSRFKSTVYWLFSKETQVDEEKIRL